MMMNLERCKDKINGKVCNTLIAQGDNSGTSCAVCALKAERKAEAESAALEKERLEKAADDMVHDDEDFQEFEDGENEEEFDDFDEDGD